MLRVLAFVVYVAVFVVVVFVVVVDVAVTVVFCVVTVTLLFSFRETDCHRHTDKRFINRVAHGTEQE